MKRVVVLLFALAFAMSVQAAKPEGPEDLSRRNKAARANLIKAFDNIDRDYVDAVDMSPLMEEAIRAMTERLDPHSVYVPAGEAEREKILMEGRYGGVGAEAQWIRDTMTVVGFGMGPAERAGVKFGDRIVSVDGRNVVGLPEDERAQAFPSGAPGSKVTFEIVRRGEPTPIGIEVVRERINSPSVVWAHHAEAGVGYIKPELFSESTAGEFREVWERQMGCVPKLIIDLRGNGGGNVETAVEMASYFLPKNALIVSTEGRGKQLRIENHKEPIFPAEGRVAILIDERSASASELFAGALQDGGKATVVGRRSFGKGLLQKWYVFGDGSRLSLTVGRYQTPSGRTIQRPYAMGGDRQRYRRQEASEEAAWGIMPDVAVPASGLECALDSLMREGIVSEYREFMQDYLDANYGPLLERYKTPDHFVAEYEFPAQWYEELVRRAARRGVELTPADSPDGRVSLLRLKAFIAERLYGKLSVFFVLNAADNDLRHAMNILTNQ